MLWDSAPCQPYRGQQKSPKNRSTCLLATSPQCWSANKVCFTTWQHLIYVSATYIRSFELCMWALWTAALTKFMVCWCFRDHAWSVHWPHESCSRCCSGNVRQEGFVYSLHGKHVCWWSRCECFFNLNASILLIQIKKKKIIHWHPDAIFSPHVLGEPVATPVVNIVTEKGCTFY